MLLNHNTIEADYLEWRKKWRRKEFIILTLFGLGFTGFFFLYAIAWWFFLAR